jgi:hypothetical protein
MTDKKCQLIDLAELSHRLMFYEVFLQRIKKLKCTFRRRKNYLANWIEETRRKNEFQAIDVGMQKPTLMLTPGDMVRVKSKEEIRKTLDRWDQLKGCGMMDDMWSYCGTRQRILKCVTKFLDERDYLMKKCNGLVTIEGAICHGAKDFGPCDRCCHYFWRVEWLEKIQ